MAFLRLFTDTAEIFSKSVERLRYVMMRTKYKNLRSDSFEYFETEKCAVFCVHFFAPPDTC